MKILVMGAGAVGAYFGARMRASGEDVVLCARGENLRAIREHGLLHSSEVKTAIMESDGAISVIPKVGPETHIETFRHRRTKYHQRKDL